MAELIADLAARLGVPRFVALCIDLMAGAEREQYVEELRALTGHDWRPGDDVFDREIWHDHWLRTWGARGLLHVWDDAATDAVVARVQDEGTCWLGGTRWQGRAAMRISVSGWRTTADDTDRSAAAIAGAWRAVA